MPADRHYLTNVTDQYVINWRGTIYTIPQAMTVYTFNEQHKKVYEDTFTWDSVQYDTFSTEAEIEAWDSRQHWVGYLTYKYNEDHLPIQIDQRIFDANEENPKLKTTLYSYNTNGQVLSETKPNGQRVRYAYDTRYGVNTRILYEQDENTTIGIYNTLTTDRKAVAATEVESNRVLQAKTEYTYDTYGNCVSQKEYTSADSYNETQFVYANGNTTTTEYDGIGRVTKVTSPDGTSTTYSYDVEGNTVTVTDAAGGQIRNSYDYAGNLIEVRDLDTNNRLTLNEYDNFNRLVESITYGGQRSENQVKYSYYDSLGRPIENGVKDASGNILYRETCVYDDYNDTKTTTIVGDSSAPDQVTEEYYDEMGYLIRSDYQVGDRFYRNLYTYDYVGNLVRARLGYSAEGGVSEDTQYTYDFNGNVLSTTDALGNVSSKTYDWTGRQLTDTDPAGNTTQFSYDALGRLLKTEKPFVASGGTTYDSVTIYEYDPNGNVITQKVSSNVPGETAAYRTTKYEYDPMGRLSTAIMYAPETRYTQYYYDALGNVLRTYTGLHSRLTISGLDQVSGSDTDYAVTAYTYDSRSNLIKMTDALGQEETYTYKADGLVGTKVDRNGNTTAYSYDAMWRPVEVTVTNGDGTVTDTMTYAYTANNLLRSQSNGSHTTTYTYDSFGHVVEEQTDGTTNASVYDTMGNRTKLAITVNGAVQSETNYTYDTLGRMTGMSNGTVTASYGYNANGSRSYVEYGNGNREEYIYNLGNCPVSVINKKGTTILSRYDYTYALDGNIVRTEESNGTVTTYSYDGMNQLVQETRAEFGAASQSLAYAYDDFGNRKTLTASGPENYTVSYTYDRNNRLLEDAKTEGGKVVRTSYFYDPNGNQTAKAIDTYSSAAGEQSISLSDVLDSGELSMYNGFNQLVKTCVNGTTVSYEYAPSGLRLSKTVADKTTSFVLDSGYVMLELQNGVVTGNYVRALNLVADTSGGSAVYYLYNGHSDVVQLTDSTGAVVRSYEYDAFGNELEPDEEDGNPFRYCAEYFDAETGRIYLRARYYDPVIGRFMSPDTHWNVTNLIYGDDPVQVTVQATDPLCLGKYSYQPDYYAIGESQNLYIYCLNNPNMFQDLNGEFINAIVGTLIGAASGALGAFLQGKNVKNAAIAGALSGALAGLALDVGLVVTTMSGGVGVAGGVAVTALGAAFGSMVGSVTEQLLNGRSINNLDVASALRSAGMSAGFSLITFGLGSVVNGAFNLNYTGTRVMQGLASSLKGAGMTDTAISAFLSTVFAEMPKWVADGIVSSIK